MRNPYTWKYNVDLKLVRTIFIKLYQSHTPKRIPAGRTNALRIDVRRGFIPYDIHLDVYGIQFLLWRIKKKMSVCIGFGERRPVHLHFEWSIDRNLIRVLYTLYKNFIAMLKIRRETQQTELNCLEWNVWERIILERR